MRKKSYSQLEGLELARRLVSSFYPGFNVTTGKDNLETTTFVVSRT